MDLNQIFFQEYKKVDKLLAEMYQEDKGVSNYIDELERTFYQRHSTAQTLKELRYIRNQLAHDPYIDAPICTESQIAWLKEFYQKLQNQQDPLSIYHNNKQPSKEKIQPPASDNPFAACYDAFKEEKEPEETKSTSSDYAWIWAILFIVGIAIGAIVWTLITFS